MQVKQACPAEHVNSTAQNTTAQHMYSGAQVCHERISTNTRHSLMPQPQHSSAQQHPLEQHPPVDAQHPQPLQVAARGDGGQAVVVYKCAEKGRGQAQAGSGRGEAEVRPKCISGGGEGTAAPDHPNV